VTLKLIICLLLAFCLSACTKDFGTKANNIYHDAHVGGSVVSFSTQSSLLASGGWAGFINIWDLKSSRISQRWQAHSDSVNGIHFLGRDKKILTAGYDAMIKLWAMHNGKITLLKSVKTTSPITVMRVDKAHKKIVTAHKDGFVRIWGLKRIQLVKEIAVHTKSIRALAIDAKKARFASSSWDGRVALITFTGKINIRYMQRPSSDARTLQFGVNSNELVGGGWFKLFSWNIKSGKLTQHATRHKGIIKSIQFSSDRKMLATISRQTDSSIYILDPNTKQVKFRLASHDLCGTSIAVSPNNRFIATTSDDASVRLWDLHNLASSPLRSAHKHGVYSDRASKRKKSKQQRNKKLTKNSLRY